MSSNLIEFMRLYERTSASSGERYFTAKLNGLRLVGFPVEAKDGQDAHIQFYVDAGQEGSQRRDRASNVSKKHDVKQSPYRPLDDDRHPPRAAKSAPQGEKPFDDDLPF